MLVYTRGCSLRFTARAEEAVARRLVDARRRHRAEGAGGGRVVQATHVALGASEDARSRELTRDLGGASEEAAHLLKQWRRRQVPVGARHGALEFGPVGVDDAEHSSLGGGVRWALCRFPTCDDAWGDAAAAPQRGPRHRRLLEELSLAAESRRIVLLEGPACSGKTAAVRDLAWLRNARLLTIAVNAETEGTDLIGGFTPTGDGPGEPSLALLNAALNLAVARGGLQRLLSTLLAHVPPRGQMGAVVGAESGAESGAETGAADAEDALAAAILACAEELLQRAPAGGTTCSGASHELVDDGTGRGASCSAAHSQSIVSDASPAAASAPPSAAMAELVRLNQRLRRAPGQRGAHLGAKLPFRIYEGPLVVAMRHGYWLLLDNVSAASPEVIERACKCSPRRSPAPLPHR